MAASAQYSVTVRVELDARQEPLGKLTAQIAEAGGALQSVDLVPGAGPEGKRVREFTIDANSAEHWEQILRSIGSTRGAKVLGFTDRTFEMHQKGKIEQHNKYPLKTRDDLSMAYTPGVARVCEYIAEDRTKAFDFTIKANTVAVVSDGSAVLGLGDIGPEAAMPVMEGKAMLFKEFAQVDAFPICLATNDPEEIIQTVKLIAPTFGGINLEDISAPRCFEIEETPEGGARHPRLPRRPARHRRRRHGRALQLAEDHRQADREPARPGARHRRRRRRLHEDDAGVRDHRDHRLRPQGRDLHRPRRLRRRLDVRHQALVRREHEPREALAAAPTR